MRVTDEHLSEIRTRGYTLVPGFLADDELGAAQACLWDEFPRPADYFADPSAHSRYSCSQFAGLRLFPTRGWAVNRLAFHPDLVDLAERYLDTDDLQLYKCEIWAKYAGAIDYDQPHHRDFGNHFSDVEVMATAPAGSLFGFPRPSDPYWNGQTVSGVQQRYPNIDMTPYGVVN